MNAILISVLSVSGISCTLALLLSIANRTIGNYGEKKLTINNDKVLTISAGSSLLSTLIEQDIFIPSACGGKGSCGYCKVKVIEGGGSILPTELGYVTEKEREECVRLACQCKVKEDMGIVIPEELFNVKQYDFDVHTLENMTPTIKYLRLEHPEGKEMDFKPGQYIQILTPAYGDLEEEVYRAYSIASSPEEKGFLDLFIGYVPNGSCTTYVHQYLKKSDQLTVIGPFGDFYYKEGTCPMLMVAIGTGMAPILAILKYLSYNKINREVTFFFGARCKKDLFMLEEFDHLQQSLPNFTFVPALSRPEPEDDWTGETGRVTDLISKYVSEGTELEAYLCGSPLMIDSVVDILKSKGVNEAFIYYDKFE